MRLPKALFLYEDENNCESLRALMTAERYDVAEAPLNPETARPADGYCLVLFDIHRLTARFLEVIRSWRDNAPEITLIVVGSRLPRASRIAVLEAGVSAYFATPVAVPELQARLRATMRRFQSSQDARLRRLSFDGGTIDLEARVIKVGEQHVRLTPTECGILEHLASHMNQTVSCNDLVRVLWGTDPTKGAHSLRRFISKLRLKLELDPAHPQYLVTEPTIGYRLQMPLDKMASSVHQ
jgi:two-component system KDP operon response regulator KdpE